MGKSAPGAQGWRRWLRVTAVLLADLILVNFSLVFTLFLNYGSPLDPEVTRFLRGYALIVTALAAVSRVTDAPRFLRRANKFLLPS